MPISVLMPALSPTMTEGNLVKWHKKAGDPVIAGEILAEIETDKATMEVEAVDEGTLVKILIAEGTESVKVNTPIALIAEEGENINSLNLETIQEDSVQSLAKSPSGEPLPLLLKMTLDTSSAHTPPKNSGAASTGNTSRVLATPLARRLAGLKNIDLNNLKGSGPRGRIIKHDIDHYQPINERQAPIATINTFEDRPLSGMRKIIAQRLTESKQQIPHFYLSMDYELDALLELRKNINQQQDEKISVNDLMIKAVAQGLQKVPAVNVAFIEGKIRYYHHSDIAIAVAIEGGLVTPILRQAESKSLLNLSIEMKKLAERARAGKLMPEEYQGGSFSLSNLGMFGVKNFQAIINPPQACILAIGAGQEKAVVRQGHLAIATVMNCTLSLDHRVVDGAVGAQFMACLKEFVENPLRLLI